MDLKEYQELLDKIQGMIDKSIDRVQNSFDSKIDNLSTKLDEVISVKKDVKDLEIELTEAKKDIESLQDDIAEIKEEDKKTKGYIISIAISLITAILIAVGKYFLKF